MSKRNMSGPLWGLVSMARPWVALLIGAWVGLGGLLVPACGVVYFLEIEASALGELILFLTRIWAIGVGMLIFFAFVLGIYFLIQDRIRIIDESDEIRPEIRPEQAKMVVALTAYNDAVATAALVKEILKFPFVVKVIVIDNNSGDNTAELANKAGATVIKEINQGYGHACIRGLQEGLKIKEADVIVLTEGDGTFVAQDLEKFSAYMHQADMVVGTRISRPLVEKDSQMNHFFTWGNLAVAFLLRIRYWDWQFLGKSALSDVGCTYRAIRKDALEKILPDLSEGGMHFSPHMILVAFEHGLSIIEIPTTLRKRVGRSKGASQSVGKGFQVGMAMIWHILTFRPKSLKAKQRYAQAPHANPRILFMASREPSNPGYCGGDIVMWEFAKYLVQQGYEVCALVERIKGQNQEEIIEGVPTVRLGGLLSLWWRTFSWYMRYGRGNYDLVICEGFGGSRIPRLAPLYVGVPIISEWHQTHRALFAAQYPKILQPFLNALEYFTSLVHRNTYLRVPTTEGLEDFSKLAFKRENIFRIPYPIDKSYLEKKKTNKTGAPNAIWLGKLRRYKAPHHAILAWNKVLLKVPEAKLTIAIRRDDLEYENYMQNLVIERKLENSINFAFNVSDQEKMALFENSRVMVFPSAVEGFGLVVLEANACDCVVIASSGVPVSAVRDNFNGLRYTYGDIDALAEKIITVLSNDALYKKLASNGREFVKEFNPQVCMKDYEDFLLGILERDCNYLSERRKAA